MSDRGLLGGDGQFVLGEPAEAVLASSGDEGPAIQQTILPRSSSRVRPRRRCRTCFWSSACQGSIAALAPAEVTGRVGPCSPAAVRHAEATRMFLRLVDVWIALRGPDHYEVGFCEHHLGTLYAASGDLQEARRRLRRALAIKTPQLGPRHPEVEALQETSASLEGGSSQVESR